jgi:hypothetical protein
MVWKMFNVYSLCSICQISQMTKKQHKRNKYGLLPPKIAESDTVSLGNGLHGSGGSHPFTIKTPFKAQSLLAPTMIDPATGWFAIVKATNKSTTSIQDFFHNTWLAGSLRPQFIEFVNGNAGAFKHEFKQMCVQDNYGIKAKPTTSHNQHNMSECNH